MLDFAVAAEALVARDFTAAYADFAILSVYRAQCRCNFVSSVALDDTVFVEIHRVVVTVAAVAVLTAFLVVESVVFACKTGSGVTL